MLPDRHNPEIIEPPLGLVSAVADDQMIASQGKVAHVVANRSVGMSRCLFLEQNGILRIADGHCAIAHVVVEIHINRLAEIACLNVRIAHVAVAQRAFDVDFVFSSMSVLFEGSFVHEKVPNMMMAAIKPIKTLFFILLIICFHF